jgi:hypothetical protein
MKETGAALGIGEDAARMRVTRAIERLRKFFSKRGVTTTTAIIAGAISDNSVQAAPAMLAKTVTAVAVTKGITASSSTLTLIKGALKVMAWAKAKTVIVAGVAVILAAGTTTLAVKQYQAHEVVPQNFQPSAKYATPQATYQTLYAALSTGDLKGFFACMSPKGESNYLATAGKGKSESELSAMIEKIGAMMSDLQITSNQVVASDKVILHFYSKRLGNATLPMRQVRGEWKIDGNLITD